MNVVALLDGLVPTVKLRSTSVIPLRVFIIQPASSYLMDMNATVLKITEAQTVRLRS